MVKYEKHSGVQSAAHALNNANRLNKKKSLELEGKSCEKRSTSPES